MEPILTTSVIYQDGSFVQPDPARHQLVCRFSTGEVEVLIRDSASGQGLAFQVMQASRKLLCDDEKSISHLLDELKGKNPWFSDPSMKVTMLLPGKGFLLVPEVLFDPIRPEELLEPHCSVKAGDLVMHDRLDSLPVVVVYSLPWAWKFQAKTRFSDFRLMHEDLCWVGQAAVSIPEQGASRVVALVEEGKVKLLATQDRQVLAYNAFTFNGENDLLYYLMLIVTRAGLRPHHTTVFLAGNVSPDNPVFARLSPWFSAVKRLSCPWIRHLSAPLKRAPHLSHLHVLSTTICA